MKTLGAKPFALQGNVFVSKPFRESGETKLLSFDESAFRLIAEQWAEKWAWWKHCMQCQIFKNQIAWLVASLVADMNFNFYFFIWWHSHLESENNLQKVIETLVDFAKSRQRSRYFPNKKSKSSFCGCLRVEKTFCRVLKKRPKKWIFWIVKDLWCWAEQEKKGMVCVIVSEKDVVHKA